MEIHRFVDRSRRCEVIVLIARVVSFSLDWWAFQAGPVVTNLDQRKSKHTHTILVSTCCRCKPIKKGATTLASIKKEQLASKTPLLFHKSLVCSKIVCHTWQKTASLVVRVGERPPIIGISDCIDTNWGVNYTWKPILFCFLVDSIAP